MEITTKELAVNFNHLNYNALLKDWYWLIGPTKLPMQLTAAGDALVQDAKGGPILFLDVGWGELRAVTASDSELHSLLASKDFVMNYFAVERVRALMQAGMRLGPGQIYSFKVLPALGGQYDLENTQVMDIAVHYSRASQTLEKARNLPPPTPTDFFSAK